MGILSLITAGYSEKPKGIKFSLDVSFQRRLESTIPVQTMDSSLRWNDTWRVRIKDLTPLLFAMTVFDRNFKNIIK